MASVSTQSPWISGVRPHLLGRMQFSFLVGTTWFFSIFQLLFCFWCSFNTSKLLLLQLRYTGSPRELKVFIIELLSWAEPQNCLGIEYTERNQGFSAWNWVVDRHLGIHLTEQAKSGLKNNDKHLSCINLDIFILQQVNSRGKKRSRGVIREKHIWSKWFQKKILFSVITVKGVQISAIILLNRAQQCLHFTWEEISVFIISAHSITPPPTSNLDSDVFTYWSLQIANHPLAVLICTFYCSQNETALAGEWTVKTEKWD